MRRKLSDEQGWMGNSSHFVTERVCDDGGDDEDGGGGAIMRAVEAIK